MNREGDDKSWETNDLAIVAALKCHNFTEEEMIFDESANSVFFVFERTPALTTFVQDMALGEVRVEPKEFSAIFAGTKDAMFNFMREEGLRPSTRRGN